MFSSSCLFLKLVDMPKVPKKGKKCLSGDVTVKVYFTIKIMETVKLSHEHSPSGQTPPATILVCWAV